ncbi:MAG: 2-oxoglutarate and iron-dependent oxygenase domain-containing protein [Actinomycetota bacterium]|nr:2-oxoglutarate and iron-dependent oxygenase domain-containing protein [Actinomycetota bacterium]
MDEGGVDQERGTLVSSSEFARYDQVHKADYQLAEVADAPDAFDDDFEFTTCDIGRFLQGDDRDKDEFARELGEAMEETGFAILQGHGVDPQLLADAEEWVQELFTSASLEHKMRFRAERRGAVSEGYFPIKETSDIHPDLVEGWVFGRVAYDLDGVADFDAARYWPQPEAEPEFRRLIEAETPLFLPIMQSILRYLGCDPHLFDERLDRPDFGQRLNYYPPLNADDRASGAGRLLGHEDIDLFTLLPAPSVDGLQALHRNGKWLRVNAPADSIILNTGDYMQRLSNDILPSTTHRVSPPSDPADVGRARVSIPLAAYLRPHELLEVLPGLPQPKYEPIKVITFHTRTTAKFYGDDYAVEEAVAGSAD